jgi:ferredoxin
MRTGPRASFGYDLALTEVMEGERHYFLLHAGTAAGREVAAELAARGATGEEVEAGERVIESTASQMGRTLDTTGIKELLYRNYEHPRWDEVADRCLTCGNCTMVCPTCFCTTVEDVTDLEGGTAERRQRWDSCFTMDFSYVHGGSVRSSNKSRYRQWMTHKLATWYDQFGTSGCVGCGRCITWCPVAIDITEEAAAIRATDVGPAPGDERWGQSGQR